MNIELSLKNILIVVGVVSAFSGNIFVLGKVFSDFELLKTEIQAIKEDQNVLELQQEILENKYKIKSLRLQIDDFGEGS
tara:strand:+ start:963 stop:1199 length:237 start_codon:yes stop_codon:yes gene_type:complete